MTARGRTAFLRSLAALRGVVRQRLALTMTGLAVGALGSLLLSRFLQHLLFGVGSMDPLTFASVVEVLMAVGPD